MPEMILPAEPGSEFVARRPASKPIDRPDWPVVSDEDLRKIYELYRPIVNKIGEYRQMMVTASSRREANQIEEIVRHVKWGAKDVLDELHKTASEPSRLAQGVLDNRFVERKPQIPYEKAPFRLAAVFVEWSTLYSWYQEELPRLVEAASDNSCSPHRTVRLVILPEGEEQYRSIKRLTASKGEPQMLCFSEYVPHTEKLFELLRRVVPMVYSPGLDQVMRGIYQYPGIGKRRRQAQNEDSDSEEEDERFIVRFKMSLFRDRREWRMTRGSISRH